jgi:hypothetical protein
MEGGKIRTKEEGFSNDHVPLPVSAAVSCTVVRGEGLHCPICLLPTGRRMRGKLYCGNCGYVDS